MAKKRKKGHNPAGGVSLSKPLSLVTGTANKEAAKAGVATIGGLMGALFIAGQINKMAGIKNPWVKVITTAAGAGVARVIGGFVAKSQGKYILGGGSAATVAVLANAVWPGSMASMGIGDWNDGIADYVDPRQIINAGVLRGVDDYADLPQVQNARQLDGLDGMDCVNEQLSSEELSSQF